MREEGKDYYAGSIALDDDPDQTWLRWLLHQNRLNIVHHLDLPRARSALFLI